MARLSIDDALARRLDERLYQLQTGQLLLQELPLSISAWYFAGQAEGRATAQREIDRLNHQLDRLYLAAFSPNDRREILLRRLDRHFQDEADRFFTTDEPRIASVPGNGTGTQPSERRAA